MTRHTRKPEKKQIDQYDQKGASRTNIACLTVPDITDALLSEIVSKIVKHFHPDKVILFGSRAWGEPTEESDLDILVVMDVNGSPIRKASEISRIARPRFLPMDIIVRTSDEIERRIRMGDPFIKRIMNRGKVLYE